MIKQERIESIARSIMRPTEISEEDAKIYREHRDWMATPKLNGVFARWDPARKGFYSKRGIRFKEHLIPHLYENFKYYFDTHFDGELWAPSLTLQQICGALAHERDEPAPYHQYILYVPFDMPYRGSSTWNDRWLMMNDHPELTITSLQFDNPIVNGDNCDGEVYRYRRGIYQPGPSGNVLKFKFWKDTEADVIAAEPGEPNSNFRGMLGALRVKFNNVEVSVGSGYTIEERAEFLENPPTRIKFKYLSLSPDGIPLNPSYIGLDL